jgi:hypothetical protein
MSRICASWRTSSIILLDRGVGAESHNMAYGTKSHFSGMIFVG